jgi:hypothetical protein
MRNYQALGKRQLSGGWMRTSHDLPLQGSSYWLTSTEPFAAIGKQMGPAFDVERS